MNAIPTRYNGTQFRSSLEARWAAMFDLLRWKWEYEPIDLDGYIPDFILWFDTPIIVEVKPLLACPCCWVRNEHEAFAALEKIERSGWRGEGLLVGASVEHNKHAMGYVQTGKPLNAGLIFDVSDVRSDDGWGFTKTIFSSHMYTSAFGFKACCGGPVDVVGHFKCRKCGHHDKGPTLLDSNYVCSLWREAGNRVQWRGACAIT